MAAPAQNESIQNESIQNESIWYQMTSMEVAQEFQVDLAQGLSTVEALARLKTYGPNSLGVEKKRLAPELWERLYRLSVPLTLFVAALLGLLFNLQFGASLLLAGLAIFTLLFGVYQDVQSEIHSTSLEMKALVRREGEITMVDSTSVVPGDIAILTPGARVPADGRLYVATHLSIDESALTGGSSPAWKNIDVIEKAQARPVERINMAFMNTTVTHGYGVMIVTGTGMNTESGTSLALLNHTEPGKKPMQGLRRQTALEFAAVAFISKPLIGT